MKIKAPRRLLPGRFGAPATEATAHDCDRDPRASDDDDRLRVRCHRVSGLPAGPATSGRRAQLPRAPIAIGAVTIRDRDGVGVIPEAIAARAITQTGQVMETGGVVHTVLRVGADPVEPSVTCGTFRRTARLSRARGPLSRHRFPLAARAALA